MSCCVHIGRLAALSLSGHTFARMPTLFRAIPLETLCVSHHTAWRFAEKARFSVHFRPGCAVPPPRVLPFSKAKRSLSGYSAALPASPFCDVLRYVAGAPQNVQIHRMNACLPVLGVGIGTWNMCCRPHGRMRYTECVSCENMGAEFSPVPVARQRKFCGRLSWRRLQSCCDDGALSPGRRRSSSDGSTGTSRESHILSMRTVPGAAPRRARMWRTSA